MELDWMLWIYMAGALIVGVFIFREELGPTCLIKNKNKRLGPNYWGLYSDADANVTEDECTIVPPKPCKDIDGVAGGAGYAAGKAVKSGRV